MFKTACTTFNSNIISVCLWEGTKLLDHSTEDGSTMDHKTKLKHFVLAFKHVHSGTTPTREEILLASPALITN